MMTELVGHHQAHKRFVGVFTQSQLLNPLMNILFFIQTCQNTIHNKTYNTIQISAEVISLTKPLALSGLSGLLHILTAHNSHLYFLYPLSFLIVCFFYVTFLHFIATKRMFF